MRLLFVLISIIAFSSFAFGQETKSTVKETPTRIEIDNQSQLQVKLVLSEIEKAEQALLIAKKDLVIAEMTLRKILNVPNDFVMRVDKDGRFFFEKPPAEKPK